MFFKKKLHIFLLLFFVTTICVPCYTEAQDLPVILNNINNYNDQKDSIINISHSLPSDRILDTNNIHVSNIVNDTIKPDTRISPSALESVVTYSAKDSIILYAGNRIIQLYGDVNIEYENITLTAEFVEIDFDKKELYATWLIDLLGNKKGKPVFKEGEKWFECYTLKYNFETKKGYLTNIFTEENEAYLHGTEVKRVSPDVIMIKEGSFTSCPDKEPHFEIKFTKAKVITDDKIVTGPVWLTVEKVPTPLALPFGFFPNKKGRQNGILIPKYGESVNRGFFLEDGGYYFGIKEYADISLKCDIYTRGSWAAKFMSTYKKRYKHDGSINLNYAYNRIGEPESPDFETSKDMFVIWKHQQDAKAHPKHRFNADVRAGSRNYTRFNPSSAHDYLSSTFSSSITFSTVFGNNVNFSSNLRHSQNKQTKTVDMNLPELALNTNRFYIFRKKERTGKPKIWENINISYSMNARNSISSPDSLLFKDWKLSDFSNGVKHHIPVSLSQNILKYLNITTSVAYTQRWYLQSLSKYWDDEQEILVTDTVEGFRMNHEYQISSQMQTKLFGMFIFSKGPVSAVRHVITPQVSFTYRPDFGKPFWGYYHYYKTPHDELPTPYSIFQTGIYGYPPFGKSGLIRFGITNNVEMKVNTPKDSLNPIKKVRLIDNFNISISNDIAKDSLNWSKLSLSGRTRLFKNTDISYIALLDPYVIDSVGRNLNIFEWDANKRLFRKSRNEWGTSFNWTLNKNTFRKKNQQTQTSKPKSENDNNKTPDAEKYDYSIPWNLTLSYTLQYIRDYEIHIPYNQRYQFIQTLSFHGEINLTPGWKIGLMSGYDFKNKEFSYTSVNIHRDLHCWEIILNWIPMGFRKSYNFTLRVKSPMLHDLKLEKRTDWRDYY